MSDNDRYVSYVCYVMYMSCNSHDVIRRYLRIVRSNVWKGVLLKSFMKVPKIAVYRNHKKVENASHACNKTASIHHRTSD